MQLVRCGPSRLVLLELAAESGLVSESELEFSFERPYKCFRRPPTMVRDFREEHAGFVELLDCVGRQG